MIKHFNEHSILLYILRFWKCFQDDIQVSSSSMENPKSSEPNNDEFATFLFTVIFILASIFAIGAILRMNDNTEF